MRTFKNLLFFENKHNFSKNNLSMLKSNLTTLFLIGTLLTSTFNESFGQLQKLVEYYSDGKTIRSKYQIDTQNRIQGIREDFNTKGNLETRANFINGKLDGLYEEYHWNGNLKEKKTVKIDKSLGIYGLVESYYESGELKGRANFINFINSRFYPRLNGEYFEYYRNGNLVFKKNYVNGEMIGLQEFRYENGTLKEKYFINSSGIQGPYISYFEDGQIAKKCQYIDGRYTGLVEEYYSPKYDVYGIKSRENYLGYFKNGKSELYGIGGKLIETGNYKNSSKDGVWKYFKTYENSTGNKIDYLYKIETYKNIRLNGEQLEYYPNGKIKSKMNYINGELRGIQESYNDNGTLNSRRLIN